MLATSALFAEQHSDCVLEWKHRPLQDFESQPLRELAEAFDLIVIDHPHLGEAVSEGLLVDLGLADTDGSIELLRKQSVGASHQSYCLNGSQWALAIDAATPVASHRPDRLDLLPANWNEVLELARTGEVILPLRPPHVLMAMFWIANNRGFSVAESPDLFMQPEELSIVLAQLRDLAVLVDRSCFEMDPIAVYDRMSGSDDAPAYCPAAYGYVSYARQLFRPFRLRFSDVPEVGTRGTSGTVLGGTGIAVSALSDHGKLAAQYAFWVAGAECQSSAYFDSGGQPGNAIAWENDACNAATDGFFRDTRRTLETSWLRPRYDGYLGFQHTVSLACNAYLQGEVPIEATVQTIQRLYRESRS